MKLEDFKQTKGARNYNGMINEGEIHAKKRLRRD
jgi:hypothetical protein